jgi:hypothetical protein
MPQESTFASGWEDLLPEGENSTESVTDDTPSVLTPSRNERKSRRHPVPEERQHCQLKVGTDVLSAVLVNKSERGFAVLIDSRNDLRVGQKVHLHTHQGWFTIRVVYITEIARPKDADSGDSDGSSCFRLGCSRIGTGPLREEPFASPLAGSLWTRLTRKLFPFLDG